MFCCIFGFIIVLLYLIIYKMFYTLSTGWDRSSTCLVGKTAIITGANTGIGFYTALDFAKRGARVILACRNKEKAENAKRKIIEQTGNTNVIIKIVDLTSLDSVRAFAKTVKETEDRLDILVNNAGVFGVGNVTTGDGLNLVMQVNHFSTALLTLLLIDLLKRSAPSRIVNVSSVAIHIAKVEVNDLNAWPKSKVDVLNRIVIYSNSKICNMLFTNELGRRLEGTNVVVNSLHPGGVRTDIVRGFPYLIKVVVDVLTYFLLKSPEEGAQTSIYVAVSKDIEGITGEYFDNCRTAWLPPMPKLARDEELAKEVWDKTEEYINLTPEERQLL